MKDVCAKLGLPPFTSSRPVRQGQPQLGQIAARSRDRCRPAPARRSAPPGRRAHSHRRVPRMRSPRSRQSPTCRRRLSSAARPISSTPLAACGKPVNIKKGRPLAGRHEAGGRQGARSQRRRRQPHGLRTRRVLRLQQPRLRHARPGHHARDGLSGGLRCDPLGAVAGRAGDVLGRTARVCSGAGAGRGCVWALPAVHGDASKRPEQAFSDGPTAGRWRAWKACCAASSNSDRAVKAAGLEELKA